MRGKAGRFSRLAPFDLLSLSGLTGWWDASDSSRLFDATSGGSAVAADGQVARLEDKSGNNRHFTQGTSAKPTRKTAVQNGLDVVRFSVDILRGNGLFSYVDIQPATASSVFIVAKATTVTTNSVDVYDNEAVFSEGSGAHGAFVLKSDDTVSSFGYDSDRETATVAYVPGSWIVFSSWHDGSSIHAKVNEDASSSASLGARTFTGGEPFLGRNWSSSYFDGDFGEMVTYSVALSDSDRSNVISHLMDKWGIS